MLFRSKEAVLKALGVGMRGGFGFKDITIDHDEKGAPVVVLNNEIKTYMKKNKIKCKQMLVSIAHDGEYATAIAQMI